MPIETPPMLLRVALVVAGIACWFLTQRLIKHRPSGTGIIVDGLHILTAPAWRWLNAAPRGANALLALSSLGVDALGLFLFGRSIFGPSISPFVGMMVLFALRQMCQAVCALPPPIGMIWRSPGVPSLLVTYDVTNDLFFSGHTALAVYGAIELARCGGIAGIIVGCIVAVFEASAVIVLRAHYTMDVYAGAVTAAVAFFAADAVGPMCDAWLIQLGQILFSS